MEQFAETTQLVEQIRTHVEKHGWHNTAKALREVVFVHVGWDADFTELDNILRKIERDFKIEIKENESDIPISPLEPPASHFS